MSKSRHCALGHDLSLAPMRRVVVWELSVSNLELGGFVFEDFCLFFFLLIFIYPSKPYFPSVHLFFFFFFFTLFHFGDVLYKGIKLKKNWK